jgi:hypothetical protein
VSDITVVGHVRKMRTEDGDPVLYTLPLGDETVAMNPLLGKTIGLRHTGNIHCVACGRKTAKSFNQGHCFPCLRRLASCDGCIVRPEQCHYHLGSCRQPAWGEANCLRPHVVYLANSSGVKVGITRETQVPTRWIDQGAAQALPIARVASRRMSGLMEVVFKEYVSDRTDWRRMLKGEPESADLIESRESLFARCDGALSKLTDEHDSEQPDFIAAAECRTFHYPVLEYPEKVTAINLDKNPQAEGTLLGIKGQYLILDTGVLNVRKYGGYEIAFSA